MSILDHIRFTSPYERAHELWQESKRNVASTLVSVSTWMVAWIVITEVLYRITLVSRQQGDISAARLLHAVGISIAEDLPPDPLFGPSLTVLTCLAACALPIVSWIFRLGRLLVGVAYAKRDKRHVAYAWSSGIVGLLCVLSESLDFLQFTSEDLLLGMSGLNMLVEEIRLIEGKVQRPDPETRRVAS